MKYYFYILFIAIVIILFYWFFRQSEPQEFIGLAPLYEEQKKNELPVNVESENNFEANDTQAEEDTLLEQEDMMSLQPIKNPCFIHQLRHSRIREMLVSIDHVLQARRDYLLVNKIANNKVSQGEFVCRVTLEAIFQLPFNKAEPDFLKSTLSAKNLELDGYNEQLKLAFEYNGIQHYVFPNYWHKSYEQFERQIKHDRYKRAICPRLGVTLLIIPYTISLQDIPEYIAALLPPEFDPYRYDLI